MQEAMTGSNLIYMDKIIRLNEKCQKNMLLDGEVFLSFWSEQDDAY
jgi:hypothetical protein